MMRTPTVVVLFGGLVTGIGSACGLDALMLESGLVPGARENAVVQCCACLATTREIAAEQVGLPRCSEPTITDAGGPNNDTTCICGLDATECRTTLLDGQRISLVGSCTEAGGVCEQECANVLAYPE